MKTLSLLITLLLTSLTLAQTCDCKSELDFYFTQSQELESYKTQIRKSKKQLYENKYNELSSTITGTESRIDCFRIISQLAALIKDEHAILVVEGVDYSGVEFDDTQQAVEKLHTSNYYNEIPRVSMDLDSLTASLQNRSIEDIEGIYEMGGFKLGMVATSKTDFHTVILESSYQIWEPGMIHGYYTHLGDNRFEVQFAKMDHTRWYNIRYERFVNGRFFITQLKKEAVPTQYDIIASSDPTFNYQKLEGDIDYIRAGSFSRMSDNVNKSKAILKEIKGKLGSTNLILDLRNNGGGADKVSKPYRKLVKRFARKGNVYIIVNKYSGSNAEITAELLSKRKNVTLVGMRTRGALSYGTNYGTVITSPSGLFRFTKTDMDYSYLVNYEEVGLPVDIELELDRDWIKQVVELIKEEN